MFSVNYAIEDSSDDDEDRIINPNYKGKGKGKRDRRNQPTIRTDRKKKVIFEENT